MEEVRFKEWSLGLNQRAGTQRTPLHGMIEMTYRCPLKCAHCYNNLPMGDRETRLNELTYEEHCRILDEIIEAGCLWLLYTGGEIFARKDFLDIYTYAKKKGILITLFTDGILLTPEIADHFAKWPPFSIEITLYGRTQKTYERITGIPGSYDKCIKGIHLLKGRGLPLKLKTMALTANKHEIWEIKRFAEEELGVEFRFDPLVNPRFDYSQSPLALRLTPQEVVELDLQDPKRMADWKTLAERSKNSVQGNDELYYCKAGITGFAIDPYGKMGLCLLTQIDRYDLRKGSFRDGWEDFLLKVRRRKITKQTKCVGCAIKALCGMCPPSGMLENRDTEEPSDFYCQVGHLRAKALGFSVPAHGDCEYCK
jgi:radical SAM protein with 4Fe4S-binding SPASM domain